MNKFIVSNLYRLKRAELKILNNKKNRIDERLNYFSEKIEEFIPESLVITLDKTFYVGFQMVFKYGTKYIERMYDRNKILFNYNKNDFEFRNNIGVVALNDLDRYSKKSSLINTSITTLEGAFLGVLGMGLPDIPLLISLILKSVYEISLNYGFSYYSNDEKIFILNLISEALSRGEKQKLYNDKVDRIGLKIDNHIKTEYHINDEIKNTSKILSDSMLISKFIQGIPVVGVIGCINNYNTIYRISKLSAIKYKKRYLSNKSFKY